MTGHDPAAGAERRFTERYGSRAAGVWSAPGRVNLIGEHTDYNDGFALPFAIGARVAVAAARRSDGLLAVTSGQAGGGEITELPVDGLVPQSVPGWAAYPAGVVWAMRAAGYAVGGVSLAVDASLRAGAGLSSSAALECAVGLALADLHGLAVRRPELAVIARRAENEFAGVPSGIMDQLAALLGVAGHALLLDCRSLACTPVPFEPAAAGLALLVIDTGARHELTEGSYAARRLACEDAARTLGVPALRDIEDAGGLRGLAAPLLRRARHVVTENQRVLRVAGLLRAGQIGAVGPLLTASHASLRDDFEVSWPEADATVEAAVGAGALGARMTGGGFGGSVIALAPAALAGRVREAVARRFALQGWPEPEITQVRPGGPAARVR